MTCGIYCITHTDSGRCYVDLSVNIERRWVWHKWKSRNQLDASHIHMALAKYGVAAFQFEVLEVCEKHQLSEREIHWVSVFNSHKKGFNRTAGGHRDGHSEHSLRKLAATMLGTKLSPEHCANISKGKRGVAPSDAHKKALSEAAKARWANPVSRAELVACRSQRGAPTAETRNKLSISLTRHLASSDAKRQRSEQMKLRYSTPDARLEQSQKLSEFWAKKRQQNEVHP